jgi:type IX secretion system PorP/SprF family membrane protein
VKKIIILSTILLSACAVWAQQQVMFTQYMFNQMALNPAYTGIHEGVSASALLREQWVGFEGAPNTQMFSIHSPMGFSPISLGGVVLRDQIGATTQHSVRLTYAYRIKLANKTKVSFGLQGMFTHYRQQFSTDAGSDPTLANANESVFRPNFGTGIMWHSDKFYLGLGVPQVLNQAFDPSNPDSDSELIRHYFLSAGYVFPLGPSVMLKPNILLKAVDGAPLQMDVNVNVLLKNIVWFGLSYRSLDSFDAVVQFQIGPKFQVGYGFDFWTTTDLSRVNSGSHEIMVNYVISLPRTKILTPRYF